MVVVLQSGWAFSPFCSTTCFVSASLSSSPVFSPETASRTPKQFTGLYFNLDEEVFEFYGPVKMADNPMWISVTDVIKSKAGSTDRDVGDRGIAALLQASGRSIEF